MPNKSYYQVVKILDEFNIVINAGFLDGIKPGTHLQIFTQGEEVKNPSTNEIEGTLDIVKAEIVAVNVSPNLSICKNSSTSNHLSEMLLKDDIPISKALQLIAPTPRPFKIDPSEVSPRLPKIDKTIKIGDLVRKLPY